MCVSVWCIECVEERKKESVRIGVRVCVWKKRYEREREREVEG